MTRAICTSCGEEKFGAWLPCKSCGFRPPLLDQLSMQLTDHYLTSEGLAEASKQVKEIKAGLRNELELTAEYCNLPTSRSKPGKVVIGIKTRKAFEEVGTSSGANKSMGMLRRMISSVKGIRKSRGALNIDGLPTLTGHSVCVCPKCGVYNVDKTDVPCSQRKCPHCGEPMRDAKSHGL
jgi:glutaredoxin